MAKEKEQKQLLAQCRYFDGKPATAATLNNNERMLWETERSWVFGTLSEQPFNWLVDEYKAAGLANYKPANAMPIEYMATLFNRIGKYSYSMQQAVPTFKQLYEKYYT